MSFDAEITQYPNDYGLPLWESLDNATVADAYAAAEAHIRGSGSPDRVVADGGDYWRILDPSGEQVATLSITDNGCD